MTSLPLRQNRSGKDLPDASQDALDAACAKDHPDCLMCGARNPLGLALQFRVQDDGSVQATFVGRKVLRSYPDRLHGGVTAALLDAAMTNALFASGVVAVTAELRVRYLEPARPNQAITVRANVKDDYSPLYYVVAELVHGSTVLARAEGKFVAHPRDRHP